MRLIKVQYQARMNPFSWEEGYRLTRSLITTTPERLKPSYFLKLLLEDFPNQKIKILNYQRGIDPEADKLIKSTSRITTD